MTRTHRRPGTQQLAFGTHPPGAEEPYAIVDIQPDPSSGGIGFVIENVSPTVARNVRIFCDPHLESGWAPVDGQPDLTRVIQEVLARTMPMLPPGRRLTFSWTTRRVQNTARSRVYMLTVAEPHW